MNTLKRVENIPEEKLDKVLALFHLLRNKTRFKILLLLMEKERNVSELEEIIGGTQSAISHQLAELRNMKLVKDRQEKRMRCNIDNRSGGKSYK